MAATDNIDPLPERRFPGEDTRPTSQKELFGWYLYGFAAEVFVVCGVGSFVPITLEQLARENGVLLSDRSTPCKAGLDIGLPPNVNSTSMDSRAEVLFQPHGNQCVIHLFGVDINTASFAMYTFSLSVLIQALLLISMSAFADHGRWRKTLLLTFAFTGAVATMLFLPITANVYMIGAIFAIIGNTCIGSSFVLLNSFLPLLVRYHPRLHVLKAKDGQSEEELHGNGVYQDDEGDDRNIQRPDDSAVGEIDDSRAALLGQDIPSQTHPNRKSQAVASPELQLSTKISSNGIGIGYIAAILVQIVSVLIVRATGGSTFSLRVVLFFIGAWWFVFTIPAALWLRPRPGPPLDTIENAGLLTYLAHAWRSLGKTVMHARRLKDVLLFLGAWFLLSDGIATVSGTAVLFAKTTLDMKPAALAMINVVVMLFGVIGAFTWSTVSRWLKLKPNQTILACLCVFELIPIYALLGYIPAIQRMGVLGLQRPWEMFLLGAVYGIVLGGLSSYCRSLFAELAPPGFEAAFFALYAITDKGSSVFGPLIVGAITDATGDIRPAFWFLAVLIGLPFPLLKMVNVERGREAGAALARELEGRETPELQRSRTAST